MPTPPIRTVKTPQKEASFLEALSAGTSIAGAAEAAGLGRATVYAWREADPDFKARWDAAVETGTDKLEDEALRRALHGTNKPVFQGGQLVGTIKEYSDTLTIFLLKGRRKEKF